MKRSEELQDDLSEFWESLSDPDTDINKVSIIAIAAALSEIAVQFTIFNERETPAPLGRPPN